MITPTSSAIRATIGSAPEPFDCTTTQKSRHRSRTRPSARRIMPSVTDPVKATARSQFSHADRPAWPTRATRETRGSARPMLRSGTARASASRRVIRSGRPAVSSVRSPASQ